MKSFYNLKILYEDLDLIIIDKPSNFITHSNYKIKNLTLVNFLLLKGYCLSYLNNINKQGLIHRLDKNTTGIIIIAKYNSIHINLCEQIQNYIVIKYYLALLYKNPSSYMGYIKTKIKNDINTRVNFKYALTYYKVIKLFENKMFSLIKCKLKTGRTHQIRKHMKKAKMPILGDIFYASSYNYNTNFTSSNKINKKILFINTYCLQSYSVEFLHPRSNSILNLKILLNNSISQIINLMK